VAALGKFDFVGSRGTPAMGETTQIRRVDGEQRWNKSAIERVFAVARNGSLTARSNAAWDSVPCSLVPCLSVPCAGQNRVRSPRRGRRGPKRHGAHPLEPAPAQSADAANRREPCGGNQIGRGVAFPHINLRPMCHRRFRQGRARSLFARYG
jgi:hypothetical protein